MNEVSQLPAISTYIQILYCKAKVQTQTSSSKSQHMRTIINLYFLEPESNTWSFKFCIYTLSIPM